MEMRKVGLVTLYKNNYGSTLQCYSLKKIIEQQGYTCILLDEKTNISLKNKILKKIDICMNSIRYPGYLKKFLSMRRAMQIEQTYLTVESSDSLEKFIDTMLKPQECTWEELLQVGMDSFYKAFFVGSDQVWNASRRIPSFFFLQFAPAYKRHTYAVSFGVSEVPAYYKKEIVKGLNNFKGVSVREEAGKKIVEKYGQNIVKQHIDPTMLLSAEYWKEFSKNVKVPREPFILIHFLNEPNDVVLKEIAILVDRLKCGVRGFAYWHKNYDEIPGFVFLNGGPEEYISLINNASYILTDSFHTTIFSINLHKNFFVFHRNYLHNFPQTSRISGLLEKFSLQDRLLTEITDNISECIYGKEVDDIILMERKLGIDFIRQELESGGDLRERF